MTDRGFRYGMAVFETIGIRNGRPILLDEHLQRGLEACVASEFRVEESWFREAGEFLSVRLKPGDAGVARLHITAGDGAPLDSASRCRMLLTYEEREAVSSEAYARGYHLRSCPEAFSPTLGGLKTHNYWPNVTGLRSVRDAGGDEGLIFNASGWLLSACMANVFIVGADGVIVTPPEGCGARRGVVRQWVIRRRNVRECMVGRKDVAAAREVFITNSWLGVMPAACVDGKMLNEQSVSKELMQEYDCLHVIDTVTRIER